MATKGRPKKHPEGQKVSYYTPKPERALKAHQKVLEDRLKAAYTKLYTLAYDKPNQREVHIINLAVKQGLEMI